jgi:hypothetical protein
MPPSLLKPLGGYFWANFTSSPASRLLRSISWRAEKLFRQRGHFNTYIWLTQTADGRCAYFETGCEAPGELADDEVLAMIGLA